MIASKSATNEPTFTKFEIYIANYVFFEKQL